MVTLKLPSCTWSDWRATKDTLHLFCQILGKMRLATTAPHNHWWNVPPFGFWAGDDNLGDAAAELGRPV